MATAGRIFGCSGISLNLTSNKLNVKLSKKLLASTRNASTCDSNVKRRANTTNYERRTNKPGHISRTDVDDFQAQLSLKGLGRLVFGMTCAGRSFCTKHRIATRDFFHATITVSQHATNFKLRFFAHAYWLRLVESKPCTYTGRRRCGHHYRTTYPSPSQTSAISSWSGLALRGKHKTNNIVVKSAQRANLRHSTQEKNNARDW